MSQAHEHHLKTGSDPRTLPDYSALRDELAKLSHPARPDVNWMHVEKLALNLFESNGVELQTAAWYTLARTQISGIHGLKEGLAILDALIRYQWSAMWPASAHARMEILSSLSKRLQQIFRTQTLQRTDLPVLYQTEQLLTSTSELLQRLELHHAAGTDTLRQMLQNAVIRLENSDASATNTEHQTPAVTLPMKTLASASDDADTRWVYVVNSQPLADVEIKTEQPARLTPAKAFITGLVTATVISVLVFKVIPVLLSHPEEERVMASVSPLPSVLSASASGQLLSDSPSWLGNNPAYGKKLDERLKELSQLPPFWTLQYGNQLVEQTQQLYPGTQLAAQAQTKWRSMLTANALPQSGLEGWSKGMTALQQLQDRLNQLDEKKGKYMTVSELKSAVFSITQALNESVPAAELIRQLQNTPEGQPASQALLNSTELQLRQLTNSYMLIKSKRSFYP
ncbi:ImpA domain-containing protein [Buttiauxella sp. B2]|uniref:VasL domain-containing protein n=1 Tax=Buttiauxella sp. B2 TaxID=2587812 RepID=UPI00111F75A8|nr:VasL domain-containing protein [Buttiauxella sp. B2]TNV23000.1 ImpA domain-containing protein [Buttiauxella sp. B2]